MGDPVSAAPSRVYRTPAQAGPDAGRLQRLPRLLTRAGLEERVREGDLVAIKIHWGEPGNTAYLRPAYVRTVVDAARAAGGRPFVTDTNVLYRGQRADALANLAAAASNGYTAETMGAPILVADGLRSRDVVEVPVPGSAYMQTARIAGAIRHADALIAVSHVKGHLLFGFGGTLKNLGMGCATAAGKHMLHADVKPAVEPASCTGCRRCGRVCPADAITYEAGPGKGKLGVVARIDPATCIGCGECVVVCPEEAIPIRWETSQEPLLQKTAEYAWAAVADKRDKVLFVNAVVDVVPDCDCFHVADLPIVPDLGLLVSDDPVAIDQAAIDLINQAPILPGSRLAGRDPQGDTIRALHRHDYQGLLAHAERIGLGTRRYELIDL